MGSNGYDHADTRNAVFAHLERLRRDYPADAIPSSALNAFEHQGRSLRLVVQSGIWKPAGFDAALTIRTTFTRPGQLPPYQDTARGDGLVGYKYRGTDPQHSDNRALRRAMQSQTPLVYFVGVASGVYMPLWPVYVVAEDAANYEFALAVDEAQRTVDLTSVDSTQRRYLERLTRMRLHQPIFRARVLRAYGSACSICHLRHAELLDAAHILPDSHPRGLPVVPNGMAMCKIHHAAYDSNIMGIRPDLVIEIRIDILSEIDGPMLRHGLQDMQGASLEVPRALDAKPDRLGLAERYEEFLRAS